MSILVLFNMDIQRNNENVDCFSNNINDKMDIKASHKNIVWQLCNEAPRPLRVDLDVEIDRPLYFGSEYHGELSGQEAEHLLQREGQYLVRKRKKQTDATLSFRVNGSVHHYHLYYDGTYFYIRPEKKFPTLAKLVAEGLLIHFLERNAESYVFNMPSVSPPKVSLAKLPRSQSFQSKDTDQHHLRISYGLYKCAKCNSFVVIFYKCRTCNYVQHDKCAFGPNICIRPKKVFGRELTDKDFHINCRPFVLEMCINEVEKRGLDAEGIYRISGFSEEVEKLSSEFEKYKSQTNISSYNIHVITGVLKRWLRKLPVPLIPPSYHDSLGEALNLNEPVAEVRRALKRMNRVHYDCLERITRHLTLIASRKEENMMNPYNLAVVFAPAFLVSELNSITSSINIVQFLINNFDNIFV